MPPARASIARPSAWNASPGTDTTRTGPSDHSTSSTGIGFSPRARAMAVSPVGASNVCQRSIDGPSTGDRLGGAEHVVDRLRQLASELVGLGEQVAAAVVVLAVHVVRVHVAERARQQHGARRRAGLERGAERADPVARHREALGTERDRVDRDVGDRRGRALAVRHRRRRAR